MMGHRENLDPKIISAQIEQRHRVYLSALDVLPTIDSTNTFLLSRLRQHTLSGQVCFAEEQTQGRGRQGKEWYSPAFTNLYCSISWCFPSTFKEISALSIACGAIIIKALQKLNVKELGLKWPNDIYYQGRKLAGILIENSVTPTTNLVVIGIGLNLFLPEEKKTQWAGLDEALNVFSRNHVAGVLLNELLANIPIFQAQGLKPFHALCENHDILRGKAISHPKISGTVQGISEKGELIVLDQQNKIHFIASLDWSLGE